MSAAIYSRFSTDKQTESSIADQVRVCREHAEKQGSAMAVKGRQAKVACKATIETLATTRIATRQPGG